MDNYNELLRHIKRIESKLSKLIKEDEVSNSPVWVNAKDVLSVTGWNANQIRYYRDRKMIATKMKGKRFMYDIKQIKSMKEILSK